MLIIGIDPGSRYCGYGLLEFTGKNVIAAGCDVIRIEEKLPLSTRLDILYTRISKVLDEYKPEQAVVESIFFHKHIHSIFTLGHARGVILLTLAQRHIELTEYSPREVKKAITGNGNASKKQVRYMINHLYKLRYASPSDDAADALAIATCHFNKLKLSSQL
ncbi:MAG: crossover junction endodeoxyribonuclease RuvC [Candidatus Cloacimonetes bacterium]|nr:crossover junction endodeoxyribonuclease RuvC [Candidatus Cloacimonadota bacterium]